MQHHLKQFPAYSIVSELTDALKNSNAIVAAPPGAGKSTVIPLALLKQITGKKILLMQPRRVVVRSLAAYLASLLNEPVGQQVGYRIRGESAVSSQTRLEVITEGILARRIQQDPELDDVGLIIFDEFHERSIHSDFGLALALDVQQGLREDLRLLVMSATLDTSALTQLLPDAHICAAQGRMYSVEVHYSGQVPGHLLHEKVANYTRLACEEVEGDVLVFLPGMGAINKVTRLLSDYKPTTEPVIHQLYGAASKEAQAKALQPDPTGRQKVILATNVAETSLTIENIEAVIDSGMENVAVFNPANGLTQLNQQMISQASATQRKGRAGRLKPGVCYRMWSKEHHDRMTTFAVPQILREDVSGLLLEALSWGTQLDELAMLNQPSEAQAASAIATLTQLGAVSESASSVPVITNYGRELASLPCHPRLAHMLRTSYNCVATHGPALLQAAVWVATLAEDSGKNKLSSVSEVLANLDPGRLGRMRHLAHRYWNSISGNATGHRFCQPQELQADAIALAIALAHEDHLAYWQNGQWKMANGRGAEWPGRVPDSKWLAVLDGQQVGAEVKIRLAETITEKAVKTWFDDGFEQVEEVRYDPQQGQMQARKITRFHQIVITSEPVPGPGKKAIAIAWLNYLRTLDDSGLPLPEPARQWLNRLSLAVQLDLPQPQAFDAPEPWPQVSQSVLSLLDEATLLKHLALCRRWDDVAKIGWRTLLQQSLPWPQQHALDHFLPELITVPVGSKRALNYRADGQVILEVKMQEMYGSTESISVGHKPYPVTISLLSPAARPLQMTRDLAAFWRGSYQQIKKEMKGRYPKHYWPDDPASATPTTRTKKHTD